jgi:diguanylate cyclase (GGDEF)-like protein
MIGIEVSRMEHMDQRTARTRTTTQRLRLPALAAPAVIMLLILLIMSGYELFKHIVNPIDGGWQFPVDTVVFSSIAATVAVYAWLWNQGKLSERRRCPAGLECEDTDGESVQENLRFLSTHDCLTGLYNRAYMDVQLSQLEHSDLYPVSMIMADVDDLKAINDTLGHHAGDKTLQLAAQVLVSACKDEEVIARMGGDEFAILVPGAGTAEGEAAVARIRAELAAVNAQHGSPALSISLGVATAFKGESPADMMRVADMWMYEEKRSKKVGCYPLFFPVGLTAARVTQPRG